MKSATKPSFGESRGRPARSAGYSVILVAWLFVAAGATVLAADSDPIHRFEWSILEDSSAETVPCRVHLRDPAGRSVKPPGYPFWHDHFVCDGRASLALGDGLYAFEIERGPEYERVTGTFEVSPRTPKTRTDRLARRTRISDEGWWSADLHVHRPLHEIELLMKAEDLHLAPVITWWNSRGPWGDRPLPGQSVVAFDRGRFYAPLAGEDERGGGALLFFGLPEPLPLDRLAREHPPSTVFLRQAKTHGGSWVDIEKPFWWDTPVWLATGLADSIGIANNHVQRSGMLDNEAWGRPRDRTLYPAARGNGLYTQDLYYRILDSGLRLPPSGGSASGVLPNPVGYNRTWVHVDGELTWAKWWEGLRLGRVFVGNGPLLRAKAAGHWPGHVFQSPAPLSLRLEAVLDSRDPMRCVELVRNGHPEVITLPATIRVEESGWFLLRAVAEVPHTLRFASTGPWYVEIAGKPAAPKSSAVAFFQGWLDERTARIQTSVTNEIQREEALRPVHEARTFWASLKERSQPSVTVTGVVVDASHRRPIPARVYVQRDDGRFFFPRSSHAEGTAIRYERRNGINTNATEFHTTLSAHPFQVDLPPGRYTFHAERGKEYRATAREVRVDDTPISVELSLERWIDMSSRGWFSGDTHVHRSESELPNLLLAEDLNVAFPLSHWVTRAYQSPTRGDKNTAPPSSVGLRKIDDTHVFWPLNTEYEIFTVDDRAHTLGAVFVLGHRTPLDRGAPPVGPIATHARREGALLDLDKHNWPWSMALVPLLGVDLFELANNHHWRTEFGITNWATPPPTWMKASGTPLGAERDWTEYGFRTYYALLDCGFRLRPSAGTASGVHPVPVGFGRVYVHLPEGFSYESWLRGLRGGNTFVTTGPMIFARIEADAVSGTVVSETPVREIEIVSNGDIFHRVPLQPYRNGEGAWEASFRHETSSSDGTRWVAVRCWEHRPGLRFRFAHTAPVWFDDPARPLRPQRQEVEFLIGSVENEIRRSEGVLRPEAIAEYRKAAQAFEQLLPGARR